MNWVSLKLKCKPLKGSCCAFLFRHSLASSMMSDEPLALHLLLPLFQGRHSLIFSIKSVKEGKLWPLQVLFGDERIRGHLILWVKKIYVKRPHSALKNTFGAVEQHSTQWESGK